MAFEKDALAALTTTSKCLKAVNDYSMKTDCQV